MPTKLTQLHLSNLGSATRTTIHCKTCQMQYNKIDPNDTRLHVQHHTSILQGPPFTKSASTIVQRPLQNSVIPEKGNLAVVTRSSPKELQKRALSLLHTIDIALGAPFNSNRDLTFFPNDGKIYFIHSSESARVISVVAAERIEFAFRRIPENEGVETTTAKENALIGISRMWTCIAEREKGLCRALLDECAAGFVLGVDCRSTKLVNGDRPLKDFVAFSTPSESGLGLARKWAGREDFLVYHD